MRSITAIAAALAVALPIGGALAESKPLAFVDCRDALITRLVMESMAVPVLLPGIEMGEDHRDVAAERKFEASVVEAHANVVRADEYIAQNNCKFRSSN